MAFYSQISKLHQVAHLVACSNVDFPADKIRMFNAATFHFKEILMIVAKDARNSRDKINSENLKQVINPLLLKKYKHENFAIDGVHSQCAFDNHCKCANQRF